MKMILLKSAFVLAILFLSLVFLVLAGILLDAVAPYGRTPSKGVDRIFLGIPMVVACLFVANRIVSSVFLHMGLSDKRWSLLARRSFD
jgi:hypothetical protein